VNAVHTFAQAISSSNSRNSSNRISMVSNMLEKSEPEAALQVECAPDSDLRILDSNQQRQRSCSHITCAPYMQLSILGTPSNTSPVGHQILGRCI